LLVPRWLTQFGCSSTASVADGCEAVKLYKQALEGGTPFDVLIMDITIPGGIGGYEVLKEILAINPNVRAIVSSGYADSPIMAKYGFYGFRGVLPKPYTKQQLYEVLAQVLK
jgi:CheY-like chemotaxis protein